MEASFEGPPDDSFAIGVGEEIKVEETIEDDISSYELQICIKVSAPSVVFNLPRARAITVSHSSKVMGRLSKAKDAFFKAKRYRPLRVILSPLAETLSQGQFKGMTKAVS
jgi:hypothetical protein